MKPTAPWQDNVNEFAIDPARKLFLLVRYLGIYSLMIALAWGWTFAHPFHVAEKESFSDETRQSSLIAFLR